MKVAIFSGKNDVTVLIILLARPAQFYQSR